MKSAFTHKIALCTIAVGKDPVYFDSVRRYFPYNRENFGQNNEVDYYVFTDRGETIEGVISIPCATTVWPYTTLLKNNCIADYLESEGKWSTYSHIFFIDADFAIGDKYDFFTPEFVLVKPYWNEKNGGGFFYGGKTEYFRKLCSLFYDEIRFIYENKLSLPRDLDEYYLGLFLEQYRKDIHIVEMNKNTNTLIFYDNENLDEKIRETGKRLFMQPYKAEGRANKTIITDVQGKQQECIVNLEESYIFNNYTYDYGRLLQIDENQYRIFWSSKPERREVLNIESLKIRKQPTGLDSAQVSPVISIVMPTYNTPLEYMKESVESILKQTFADFELLVVDDGSTETQGIEWLETLNDRRIRLIRNSHDFIDSLNRGIAESCGKYIARMDADDIMLPNRLQVQYDFMEEHTDIDICGSWMEVFGNENGTIQLYTDHKQIITSLLLYNSMAHPTVILRISTVCKKGEPLYKHEYNCAEDYKLWIDLAIVGCKFANVSDVLLKYRRSDNHTTKNRYKELQINTLKIQTEYVEAVMQKITDKKEKLLPFFDSLIEISNEDVIEFSRLLEIVHMFYEDYLRI